MHRSPNYLATPEEIEEFVQSMRHGYLIATAPGQHPSVSILPFLKEGDTIELHCVRADPTFLAMQQHAQVTFLVADFLAATPHQWIDPQDAGRATLHFRAVEFACEASWSLKPADIAASLDRLAAAYDGAGTYRPVEEDGFYGPRLDRLVAVSLRVLSTDAKFKVGPAGKSELKQAVADHLRARTEPGDGRAAAIIERRLQMAGRPGLTPD